MDSRRRAAPRLLCLRSIGLELRPAFRFKVLDRELPVSLERDLLHRPLRCLPQLGLFVVAQRKPGSARVLVDAREEASADDPILVVEHSVVAEVSNHPLVSFRFRVSYFHYALTVERLTEKVKHFNGKKITNQ